MTWTEGLERRFTEPNVVRCTSEMTSNWERVAPGDAGFAPELADRLETVLSDGRASGLHGLVVVRGDRLVLDHYGAGPDFSWAKPHGEVTFDPTTLHDLRSVTKSVVALLYGIALDDGSVPHPHEPLLEQFPEYPALATDPARGGLTIYHALTMTLGLEWREQPPHDSHDNGEIAMMLSPDRWKYVLERPVVDEPGTGWTYCGGASELLGRIIAKGTGVPLHEFARTRLFEPLGIATFEWLAGYDGVESAASGLRLTPRDLARIGQLVLNRGVWDGRAIVPERWLDDALRLRVEADWGNGYGYQWYRGGEGEHRWVGGIGNGDQRLMVFPELDLVVAITTGDYDVADGTLVSAIVDDVILAAV